MRPLFSGFVSLLHIWTLVGLLGLMTSSSCRVHSPRPAPSSAEQKAYFDALDLLDARLFEEAIQAFRGLKTKYPYSKFAALADLGVADTYFEQRKFLEAIDAYRIFNRLHPSHERVAFATLQIAESYHRQLPKSWWLLPPIHEKDQKSTEQAIRAYQQVQNQFQNGPEAEKAAERIAECQQRLAHHEFYVAHYYYKKKNYPAVLTRVDIIIERYPDAALTEQALWLALESAQLAKLDARTQFYHQELQTRFPDSRKPRRFRVKSH